MKAAEYPFRNFYSETRAVREEDGTWKVIIDNVERASLDGENWTEEKTSVMVMDNDFDNAHKIALHSLFAWIDENVHRKGFSSMIDAAEHYRALGKKDKDGQKTDDNTSTPSVSDGGEAESS